ncbi:unnamed protein product [Bursaphelenchus okinawaensis]|uniref:Vitellogenin n=1 Tax=Bursaphelenchus okinawaensis TaxID=465554 RepID=A0A811KDA2_9BILA|nr:unnamed protein product [Bursaphelenchus okinawaensis]CAG9097894.1 unnamed protein product [Bursaphelenchus okinawaensis]
MMKPKLIIQFTTVFSTMRSFVFIACALLGATALSSYKSQHTYRYRFDTQVASSLQGVQHQNSATRLRAELLSVFTSDRHVQCQLENIRIGEMNAETRMDRMLPFELFQKQRIPEEVQQKLDLPFEVDFVDGTVERIAFHEQDSAWSKNIKRAVINMFQANLKRSNVQNLKMEKVEEQTQFFTIPEITVDGECEVSYTILKPTNWENDGEQYAFNVTKSVNFDRCQRNADVLYNHRPSTSQEQECQDCIRNLELNSLDRIEAAKHQQCQPECRGDRADQDIHRSTVHRLELNGQPEKRYAVRRAQIISQYLVRAVNPAEENTVAQTIAISEVSFISETKETQKLKIKSAQQEETLMFSAEWDLLEKRFYMYGDEEFPEKKQQPFGKVTMKTQTAINALKHLKNQWEDRKLGYELDSTQHFNELVQVIRQSSMEDLKKMEEKIEQINEKDDQVRSFFHDALAVAATRNTLRFLIEKIERNEISDIRAMHMLKTFGRNQHSPSDRQTELFERLAKKLSQENRSSGLKQTAWLQFSASVARICQQRPSQTSRSLFRQQELCSQGKREQYQQTLYQLLDNAETMYQKTLALKCIGNAALEITIPRLAKILNDKRQPTLLRIEAIDALRRMRSTMSQNIQTLLMPIFLNQREQPEVRMSAFSMLMHTRPQKAILDQLTMPMIMERSQQVKSFVVSIVEALTSSPLASERRLASQIQGSLKMIKADSQYWTRRASAALRIPVYVAQQEEAEERDLIFRVASIVAPTNVLPIHLCASLRAALNGHALDETLSLQFNQKNLEQWYERALAMIDDSESQERYGQKLSANLYKGLGIKNRRHGVYWMSDDEETTTEQRNQPYGMMVLRVNEIDQWILPIEETSLPGIIRKLLNGEKPNIKELLQILRELQSDRHYNAHTATNLYEKKTKIATTSGLPLAVIFEKTLVASTSGQLNMKPEARSLRIRAHSSAIATHSMRTEVWSPVTVSGVESHRTFELSAPVDFELKQEKNALALTIRMPEKSESRVMGIHVLPVTYTRLFSWTDKTYKPMRLQAVHNYELAPMQRVYEHEAGSFRTEGHVHIIKDSRLLVKALYTTENNVHVYYKPQATSVQKIVLRVEGKSFERVDKMAAAEEINNFYSQSKFDEYETEENQQYYQQMGLESDEKREKNLKNYLKKYTPRDAYRHELRLIAQIYAAEETREYTSQIGGQCDARLRHCNVEMTADNSLNEKTQWSVRSKAQLVLPEILRADESSDEKQTRMLISWNTEWNTQSQDEQNINVRIQAEPTRVFRWIKDEEYGMKKTSDSRSRFLNKIDMLCKYNLNKQNQHALRSVYELLKARFFWTLSLQSTEHKPQQVRATLIVDPVSRQVANLTIRTPTEVARADSMVLPFKFSGFQLERRPMNIKSAHHIVRALSSAASMAECRADSRRIRTFDGVDYKAPFTSCWSVLAKDCSRDEPRFSVMMKNGEEEYKTVKIVTLDHVIELIGQESRTLIKVNDKTVDDEEQLYNYGIEKTSEKKFIVSVRGITVQFDGRHAKVQISGMYKNLQCGLCGHYDNEEDSEFRMSDNRVADNLKEFHQSYTLKNKECQDSFDKSYKNDDEFRTYRQQRRGDYSSEDSYEYDNSDYDRRDNTLVKRTVVQEMKHKLCFSLSPVSQCPRSQYADDDAAKKTESVDFACIDRSEPEARRYMNLLKRNNVLSQAKDMKKTMSMEMELPTRCITAY